MTRETSNISSVEQLASANMELLRDNPYPGRGIVMGLSKDGQRAVQVYWIMGRSLNSRNRILVQEGDVVKTRPFDESKVENPSLIIYTAMRMVNGIHIVSNGDQTDTVSQAIADGHTFQEGLEDRTYEPDDPNFTPRITGMYHPNNETPFSLSIIRKNPTSLEPIRTTYQQQSLNGIGRCIHTYKGDGNPLPSFDSEPYPIPLEGTIDDIAQKYWNVLNSENKVALVVKEINTVSGETNYRIVNKLGNKS